MIVALLALTRVAEACAVCTDPTDPRTNAYFDMTMVLSLLPLAAMGGIGFWLYRRFQAAELEG